MRQLFQFLLLAAVFVALYKARRHSDDKHAEILAAMRAAATIEEARNIAARIKPMHAAAIEFFVTWGCYFFLFALALVLVQSALEWLA